jgi:hypothetical protein
MQPSESVGKWKAAASAERERRENAMIQAEQREWSPTRRHYFPFAFQPLSAGAKRSYSALDSGGLSSGSRFLF